MSLNEIATTFLISLGAVAMFLSLLGMRQLLRLLKSSRYSRRWETLSFLMVFFLVGYLVSLLSIFVGLLEVLFPILTGMIFFFGALFVYLVVQTGRLTIDDLFKATAERKRAEEQLQRYAAELEQANEELKRLTYLASHNLRAPLINLKGFAAELRAALAVVGSAAATALPHLDEKQRPTVTMALQEDAPEALGFIDSSVTRMDRLTKALLKLSRLGRRKLKPEPIDMNAQVQAALRTLAHQIEECQVSVTVEPLPEVVADRPSMEQILGNLLGNAVKYLDPGRPGEIKITSERDQDEITFRICDNGRGIAEEDMDKVFAPFRRVGKQDVLGEGMGLPYVQTLVRRHGGRMWCESEAGKGSTFYFTIPRGPSLEI
jgi:signal transduction histidine kinase